MWAEEASGEEEDLGEGVGDVWGAGGGIGS